MTTEIPNDPADINHDELVPDPQILREFGICAMTLWRWDRDPALGFPPPIRIRGRKFRSRRQAEAFKRRLLDDAVARRSETAA
ncbi:MAG: hypothetical protein ACLPTZ_07340 [Beijerinckiaceae bacterium]